MRLLRLMVGLAIILLLPVLTASAAAPGAGAVSSAMIVEEIPDVPGDFNEDSNPDLLLQNSNRGDLQVWLMGGTKPLAQIPVDPSGYGDASLIAVGTDDFDGDNRTDILFWRIARTDPMADRIPTEGTLLVWHMNGVTVMYQTELAEHLIELRPVSVMDYNADGNPDILMQDPRNGELLVWLLSGTTVIGKLPLSLMSPEAAASWRVQGSGDFDGDGDPDLVLFRQGDVIGNRSDQMAIAFMDGSVGTVVVVTQLEDRNWVLGSVADFTRDLWPDLFWENRKTGETGTWEMEGMKITARYVVTFGSFSQKGWHIVGPR